MHQGLIVCLGRGGGGGGRGGEYKGTGHGASVLSAIQMVVDQHETSGEVTLPTGGGDYKAPEPGDWKRRSLIV